MAAPIIGMQLSATADIGKYPPDVVSVGLPSLSDKESIFDNRSHEDKTVTVAWSSNDKSIHILRLERENLNSSPVNITAERMRNSLPITKGDFCRTVAVLLIWSRASNVCTKARLCNIYQYRVGTGRYGDLNYWILVKIESSDMDGTKALIQAIPFLILTSLTQIAEILQLKRWAEHLFSWNVFLLGEGGRSGILSNISFIVNLTLCGHFHDNTHGTVLYLHFIKKNWHFGMPFQKYVSFVLNMKKKEETRT